MISYWDPLFRCWRSIGRRQKENSTETSSLAALSSAKQVCIMDGCGEAQNIDLSVQNMTVFFRCPSIVSRLGNLDISVHEPIVWRIYDMLTTMGCIQESTKTSPNSIVSTLDYSIEMPRQSCLTGWKPGHRDGCDPVAHLWHVCECQYQNGANFTSTNHHISSCGTWIGIC